MSAHQNEPTWRRVIGEIRHDPSPENWLEAIFKIKSRGSSVQTEIIAGGIHFLSVCGQLAINPTQLSYAGYDKGQAATATALSIAVACIATGVLANLPFVSTPTLAASIYFSVFLKNYGLSLAAGNVVIFLLSLLMVICSVREIIDLLSRIIPKSIKLGVCIGLSLLISLKTLWHLKVVVIPEDGGLLTLGTIHNTEAIIVAIAFTIIAVALHFKVKGSYVLGLFFGSMAHWMINGDWPTKWFAAPDIFIQLDFYSLGDLTVWKCVLDLFIICTILNSGLCAALTSLTHATTPNMHAVDVVHNDDDQHLPRRRWMYFSCALGTMTGAVLGSGPILLSPESAPGILAGARTGFSAVVCGGLFLCTVCLYPLWASIPHSGADAILLMVGVLLFENTGKVNWHITEEAVVVYITAIFSAFTYSIFHGVLFGLAMYVVLLLLTRDWQEAIRNIFEQVENFLYHPDEGNEHDLVGILSGAGIDLYPDTTRPRGYTSEDVQSTDTPFSFHPMSYHDGGSSQHYYGGISEAHQGLTPSREDLSGTYPDFTESNRMIGRTTANRIMEQRPNSRNANDWDSTNSETFHHDPQFNRKRRESSLNRDIKLFSAVYSERTPLSLSSSLFSSPRTHQMPVINGYEYDNVHDDEHATVVEAFHTPRGDGSESMNCWGGPMHSSGATRRSDSSVSSAPRKYSDLTADETSSYGGTDLTTQDGLNTSKRIRTIVHNDSPYDMQRDDPTLTEDMDQYDCSSDRSTPDMMQGGPLYVSTKKQHQPCLPQLKEAAPSKFESGMKFVVRFLKDEISPTTFALSQNEYESSIISRQWESNIEQAGNIGNHQGSHTDYNHILRKNNSYYEDIESCQQFRRAHSSSEAYPPNMSNELENVAIVANGDKHCGADGFLDKSSNRPRSKSDLSSTHIDPHFTYQPFSGLTNKKKPPLSGVPIRKTVFPFSLWNNSSSTD